MGLGAGVALTAGGVVAVSADAGPPGRRPALYPVSMAMHTHASFSEGGSFLTGGGGASMMAQLEQATLNDVDVVWWTEHDWRMQAYGYYDGIAFDGTEEDGGLAWTVMDDGDVTEVEHRFVDEPHSPHEAGRAMRVTATGGSGEWGTSLAWADAGNSFYSTNLSDTTLRIDVLAEQVSEDAELVMQVETSYRPATAGRPAGVYVLEYRVGTEAASAWDTALTAVVTVAATSGWQTLAVRPLEDIRVFWPDLVAEDSGLARLRFGVRVRNGATAAAVFDHLRIARTRDLQDWPLRTQRSLMGRLAKRYPAVTQLQSAEVSLVRHLNVFMERLELYPYPPAQKAPVLDGSVAAAERVVRWYHERGALVQYNHPPIDPVELVETRALGTDLMEVAAAKGELSVVFARLGLFDVAARNAVFLTATSQIDNHEGRDWAGLPHLYLTSVWASSTDVSQLLAALAGGDAWCHHRGLWPTGRLDLMVSRRRAMGKVVRTAARALLVDVIAENLPAGSRVDVVVGACDRTGATVPSVERSSYAAASLRRSRVQCRVERGPGRYLRVEVYDASGVLIGFGNPVWLLPRDAVAVVPAARRLGDRLD
jgi:hypothetical protein